MSKAGIKYGKRLTSPDYAAIAENAEKSVLKALGLERPEDLVAKVRPEDLLVRAADVVRQADAEMAVHLDDRDRSMAHLWFYEPRLGLARAAGLTIVGFRHALARLVYGNKTHPLPDVDSNEELARVGEELGVEPVEDAEEKFLKAAPLGYAARIRRDKAVYYMQEAVLALSQPPYEWGPEKIAEHAGVERKVIYKQRTTAQKRHGLHVPRSAKSKA
ncbi:hypothetical protein [Streptomyces sp. CL12-4]|uniref:hypothetical protein n=1 Tax=Streptomyces sp. CL12-4 TaxID=2810306 RepID=UPI001EFBFDF1|nr:hypothetical protein [Streptomyces sp. CL12-4]MCG8971806.1 hypothetical protein [Streptomyces sp. CL12-4]